jgi:hypothetical protein
MYDYARQPEIDEILIVPLANPSGAYIRIDDREKIPVLAKVRSVFSNTVNVINVFGYIYNVPITHTELFNFDLSEKYYSDMITYARNILNKTGYHPLDNQEFFKTQQKYVTYVMNHYPSISSGLVSLPKILSKKNENDDPKYVLGKIKVIAMNLGSESKTPDSLLHYIEKTNADILYDPGTGELLIHGYGMFTIDSAHIYTKNQSNYMIFRSHRNYFNVKFKRVKKIDSDSDSYTIPLKLTKTVYGYYEINTVRPKQHKTKHQKYFDVITKIKKELF